MVSLYLLKRCLMACLLLLACSAALVDAFRSQQVSVRPATTNARIVSTPMLTNREFQSHFTVATTLFGNGLNDEDEQGAVDNFDAKGFGGYLAPYALALVASVLVTAAFFKFVLLDY